MRTQNLLKSFLLRCGLVLILVLGFSFSLVAVQYPPILSHKKQAEIVDNLLKLRLDKVIPVLMRREKIDMWLVICREYNEDPIYLTMVPYSWYSARRTSILVFFDTGKEEVERLIVQKRGEKDLYTPTWTKGETDPWKCLADIIKTRNPKKIGINQSLTFNFGDGLTAALRDKLQETLGQAYSTRLCSAENLAVGWLETRIPEELELYPHIIAVTHAIVAEAFSNGVIIPGVTTTEDVEWWMVEKIHQLGLKPWFPPSIDIQRPTSGTPNDTMSGVIQRGDLLHCDIGITYMRLNSDVQQMAYVLKQGETKAPTGLEKALQIGNLLQDVFTGEFKVGLTGNELLHISLTKAKAAGINGQIYTHPIGFHGHAAGPTIGLWDNQESVPGCGDYKLFSDTCYSIELNARVAIPEWNQQPVRIALEEDAAFTQDRVYYLHNRQTELYLIH